jgi:hypothetical protein
MGYNMASTSEQAIAAWFLTQDKKTTPALPAAQAKEGVNNGIYALGVLGLLAGLVWIMNPRKESVAE